MRKAVIIFISVITVFWFQSCQTKQKNLNIAFYNVENLFDTIDSPDTNDKEFLPDSKLKWNTEKVNQKIKNISRVLMSIDSLNPLAFIGLCEVENKSILTDLSDYLIKEYGKNHSYVSIHKESPDFRGIDVALLYKEELFKVIETEFIKIRFPFDTTKTTRDILYVYGILNNKETLHLFVNHWTSRWGGQEVTEPKRIYLAKLIKERTKQILKKDQNAKIIIMGDLNDNPTDKSLTEFLGGQNPEQYKDSTSLYNLSLPKFIKGEGTLFWKSWDLFDQFIVSGNMIKNNSKVKVVGNTHHIFKKDWMLFKDNKGNMRPSRTASGGRYYEGYSDHLPVWLTLQLK